MYRLVFILSLICLKAVSQISFSEADQKTYNAIIKKDYYEVIQVGENAIKSGHDFYYLHYRLGIAYYHTNNFYKSEKELLKRHQETPTDTTILSYLYWNYKMMGNDELALNYALKMPKETRKRMGISKNINVDLSPGIIVNSNRDLAGTMKLSSFSYKFSPLKKSIFELNATTLNQKIYWGNYNQSQAFLSHTYTYNPKWSFSTNYHFIQLNGQVNTIYTQNTSYAPRPILTPEGPKSVFDSKSETSNTSGSLNQANHIFNFNSQYRESRNTYSIGLNYYQENNWDKLNLNKETILTSELKNNLGQTENKIENTTTTDSSYTNNNINLYQLDLKYSHHFKQNNNGLWAQTGISTPITTNQLGISLFGSIYAKTSDLSWIGFNYHYNSNLNAVMDNGKIINNGIDYLNSLFGIEWKYYFSEKWQINLNYIKEYKTEYYLNTKYRNTAILGTIKYKF